MEYNIDDLILRDETDVQFFEIKFSTVGFGDDESEVYQFFGSKKIVLGKILNGKKTGLWVDWFENGQKKSTKTFNDGVLFGEHTWWYEDGKLEKVCNHCGTGVVKTWYENGQLKKDGFYEEGMLNGTCVYYYENGNLKEKSTLKKGEYYGLVERYYENGNLEIRFTKIDDKLIGDYESYFENGQLKVKCSYKDDYVHGAYFEYYDNGNLKTKDTNKLGEVFGAFEVYYENGQLEEKGFEKDGLYYGTYESYYENGQLNSKFLYKDNQIYGVCEEYYENGHPKRIGVEFKDLFSGVRYAYYKNGNLYEQITYENDVMSGSFKFYFASGDLRCEGIHVNGEVCGLYEEYFDNRVLRFSGNYINGVIDRTFDYKLFYKNGNLCESCDSDQFEKPLIRGYEDCDDIEILNRWVLKDLSGQPIGFCLGRNSNENVELKEFYSDSGDLLYESKSEVVDCEEDDLAHTVLIVNQSNIEHLFVSIDYRRFSHFGIRGVDSNDFNLISYQDKLGIILADSKGNAELSLYDFNTSYKAICYHGEEKDVLRPYVCLRRTMYDSHHNGFQIKEEIINEKGLVTDKNFIDNGWFDGFYEVDILHGLHSVNNEPPHYWDNYDKLRVYFDDNHELQKFPKRPQTYKELKKTHIDTDYTASHCDTLDLSDV